MGFCARATEFLVSTNTAHLVILQSSSTHTATAISIHPPSHRIEHKSAQRGTPSPITPSATLLSKTSNNLPIEHHINSSKSIHGRLGSPNTRLTRGYPAFNSTTSHFTFHPSPIPLHSRAKPPCISKKLFEHPPRRARADRSATTTTTTSLRHSYNLSIPSF